MAFSLLFSLEALSYPTSEALYIEPEKIAKILLPLAGNVLLFYFPFSPFMLFSGAMGIQTIIYIIAAPIFLLALGTHIYVKLRFRIGKDSDFDDYYHEFEDSHPQFEQYRKWTQASFTVAAIAALLLFIAVAL
jgi:type IV secretory pathway VirB3-like protein